MIYEWELPIKTVSEFNSSEHWSSKSRRHRQQQFFVKLSYQRICTEMALPCVITLTRLSPRLLDSDNLGGALKYVRDEIAECILPHTGGLYKTRTGWRRMKGHADSDPRLTWQYEQEQTKSYGIRIRIECQKDGHPCSIPSLSDCSASPEAGP